ncbi:MAG TPA: DUF2950 domain-containing protein [Bryobacteraceae bacterium]|nr:DUF2950 domain-containing protein [Bryobacteraceae bacterium]
MDGRFFLLAAAATFSTSLAAQQRFDSPEAAAQAIVAAAEHHDAARLAAIIGPSGKNVLTSGNPTQDRAEQTEFARMAAAKHRLEVSAAHPNRAILAIGDDDWPFPVPIVRKDGKWSFDASQAATEMHARRIGSDELDAIEVCYGYVDAQKKYAAEDRDADGLLEYAPRLMSSPGKHDGLYWKDAADPLIPEGLAEAGWDGLHKGTGRPYHGYYFRILDGQGDHAPGGAHNYAFKGELLGGFGLVAWPAEYGVSGIHTFVVNQDGKIYQKDIEPARGKAAAAVTRYDPDSSWDPVD